MHPFFCSNFWPFLQIFCCINTSFLATLSCLETPKNGIRTRKESQNRWRICVTIFLRNASTSGVLIILHSANQFQKCKKYLHFLIPNAVQSKVNIVDCPDLRKSPWNLTNEGLGGKPTIAGDLGSSFMCWWIFGLDVGGPDNLHYTENNGKSFQLKDICKYFLWPLCDADRSFSNHQNSRKSEWFGYWPWCRTSAL